jgi:hypothetical protein
MCGVKISEEARVWLPAVCQMVKPVYINHTLCAVFKKRQLLWCGPPLLSCCFSCCLLLLVDTEAIICHWLCIKSKWVKKPMYGYQQYVNGQTGLYWSESMRCLQKKAHTAMTITVFLLLVPPSWHWGHYLSLVMYYGVKMTEESLVWLPAVC